MGTFLLILTWTLIYLVLGSATLRLVWFFGPKGYDSLSGSGYEYGSFARKCDTDPIWSGTVVLVWPLVIVGTCFVMIVKTFVELGSR